MHLSRLAVGVSWAIVIIVGFLLIVFLASAFNGHAVPKCIIAACVRYFTRTFCVTRA